jgi:hypothetical protein
MKVTEPSLDAHLRFRIFVDAETVPSALHDPPMRAVREQPLSLPSMPELRRHETQFAASVRWRSQAMTIAHRPCEAFQKAPTTKSRDGVCRSVPGRPAAASRI